MWEFINSFRKWTSNIPCIKAGCRSSFLGSAVWNTFIVGFLDNSANESIMEY